MSPIPSASVTARARARAELTTEILAAAGDELAEVGAAALSLRSVARRLGMVASALYRYFDSRDALLTALIVSAYDEVGATAEEASAAAAAGGGRPLARWLAVCTSVRSWAAAHPQRWALIYGSPVPGYAAPEVTISSAVRVVEVLAALVRQADGSPSDNFGSAPGLDEAVDPVRALLLPGRPGPVISAALAGYVALIGTVSMERFGHFHKATTDFDVVFTNLMEAAGRAAGLS